MMNDKQGDEANPPKKPKELGDWVPTSQLLLKLTSLVISMMGIECLFQNTQA
jgi:hypothetical protein